MDMLLRSHCDKGEYKEALEIAERARTAFKSIGNEASHQHWHLIQTRFWGCSFEF